MSGIQVIKADGTKELFQSDKLVTSLERAGAKPEVYQKIVRHIESEIQDGMTTADIYNHAYEILAEEKEASAARYSLRRALVGLGPTGFPFEIFMAEVYKTKGFNVETGMMVKGKCVSHEIDLIAYNDKDLIMAELKFHNTLGFKTDLKVVLYVKARSDDLMDVKHSFMGTKFELKHGLVITNTKFTSTAIKFAECAGLKLIGWNYPRKENLQSLIEDSRLHPVSCLTHLNSAHKKMLFDKGVVLCKSLRENKSLLDEINISPEKRDGLIYEIEDLCRA